MVTERSLGHCILDNSQDQQIDGKVIHFSLPLLVPL